MQVSIIFLEPPTAFPDEHRHDVGLVSGSVASLPGIGGMVAKRLVRGNLWLTGKFLRRQEVDLSDYPDTPDGRYFIVRGRLWRKSNPALAEDDRQRLVNDLMSARRAVQDAKGNSNETAKARRRVDDAKVALGERGPVWWSDGSPDFNRHMVENTPYADWYSRLINLR